MVDPPQRVGRYELLTEFGRGGMGVVWEARDPALPGRRLALKLLRSDLADVETMLRFLREAELMARVRHPGLLPIHATGQGPGGPYLVVDLVEGRSLEQAVAEGGWAPARAVEVLIPLCEAAAALHRAGIVHRDLKPQNVMLRADGAPVLLDFGLARELDRASLTRTGELLGTPAYMAPEQVRDPRRVDERADVYALGAVLYALLRGRAPFRGTIVQVLEGVLERGPDWPACADDRLDAICRRALARDPADRWGSAAELCRALRGWRSGAPVGARRRGWLGVAGGLALLLLPLPLLLLGARWLAREPSSTGGAAGTAAVAPVPEEPPGERLLRELESAPPEQVRARWRALRRALEEAPRDDPLRARLRAQGPRLLCATRALSGLCATAQVGSDRLFVRDARGVWGWTPGVGEPEPLRTLAPGGDSLLLPPLLLREERGQLIVIEGPAVTGLALPDLQPAWSWTGSGPARVLAWTASGTLLTASGSALAELSFPPGGEPQAVPRGDWDGVVTTLVPAPDGRRVWVLQRPTRRHACVTVREVDLERVWTDPGAEREVRPEPLCGVFAGGLLLGRIDGSVTGELATWRLAGGGEVKGLLAARRAPAVWVAATREHRLRLGRIDLRSPGGAIPTWDLPLQTGRSPALGLSLSPDEEELAVSGSGWVALFGLPPPG